MYLLYLLPYSIVICHCLLVLFLHHFLCLYFWLLLLCIGVTLTVTNFDSPLVCCRLILMCCLIALSLLPKLVFSSPVVSSSTSIFPLPCIISFHCSIRCGISFPLLFLTLHFSSWSSFLPSSLSPFPFATVSSGCSLCCCCHLVYLCAVLCTPVLLCSSSCGVCAVCCSVACHQDTKRNTFRT